MTGNKLSCLFLSFFFVLFGRRHPFVENIPPPSKQFLWLEKKIQLFHETIFSAVWVWNCISQSQWYFKVYFCARKEVTYLSSFRLKLKCSYLPSLLDTVEKNLMTWCISPKEVIAKIAGLIDSRLQRARDNVGLWVASPVCSPRLKHILWLACMGPGASLLVLCEGDKRFDNICTPHCDQSSFFFSFTCLAPSILYVWVPGVCLTRGCSTQNVGQKQRDVKSSFAKEIASQSGHLLYLL